ncbi:MAG: hypothetical protein QF391_16850, partial [Myxococcota bacterium]|nr:hypothetical protein [Myxococcota bacterium]
DADGSAAADPHFARSFVLRVSLDSSTGWDSTKGLEDMGNAVAMTSLVDFLERTKKRLPAIERAHSGTEVAASTAEGHPTELHVFVLVEFTDAITTAEVCKLCQFDSDMLTFMGGGGKHSISAEQTSCRGQAAERLNRNRDQRIFEAPAFMLPCNKVFQQGFETGGAQTGDEGAVRISAGPSPGHRRLASAVARWVDARDGRGEVAAAVILGSRHANARAASKAVSAAGLTAAVFCVKESGLRGIGRGQVARRDGHFIGSYGTGHLAQAADGEGGQGRPVRLQLG